MNSTPMPVWRLKKDAEKRFRSGHPWIFSNELVESPKGLEPGRLVELKNSGGDRTLAFGYGNPASLIALRILRRVGGENEAVAAFPPIVEFLRERLSRALRLRVRLGIAERSFRWVFGEGDGLPGLIVDAFSESNGRVFAIQAQTAGADRWCADLPELLLQIWSKEISSDESRTARVLVRNDASARKMEGLLEKETALAFGSSSADELSRSLVTVLNGVTLEADLWRGQKTGLFLDQSYNLTLAADAILRRYRGRKDPVRILDLCSYVGQWGAVVGRALLENGIPAEVTAVDVSAPALEKVSRNLARLELKHQTICADVGDGLPMLDSNAMDVVVLDPPALIKGKKHFIQGKQAYIQWNGTALRALREDGVFVSASCSFHLSEPDFLEVLGKAFHRSGKTFRLTHRGMQGPDHPVLPSFPEGQYLKLWIGM